VNIYKCYVSDTTAGADTLFACLYVAKVSDKWVVISRYHVDDSGGWVNRGGKEIKGLRGPMEKQILQNPNWPKYLEVYKEELQ
jgi:hypothetical protein